MTKLISWQNWLHQANSIRQRGFVSKYRESSTNEVEMFLVQTPENWMTPILYYLNSGDLPTYCKEARKLCLRASRFVLINEILYKQGFMLPYLRCLTEDEANYALREVYEGICGDHLGA